jgi:hypothetical protein
MRYGPWILYLFFWDDLVAKLSKEELRTGSHDFCDLQKNTSSVQSMTVRRCRNMTSNRVHWTLDSTLLKSIQV